MLSLHPIVAVCETVNRLMGGVPTPRITQTGDEELCADWGPVAIFTGIEPACEIMYAIGVDDDLEYLFDEPVAWVPGEPLPEPVVRAFETVQAEETEYQAAVAELLTSDDNDPA